MTQEVEKKMTRFQQSREALKARVKERYNQYIEAGSTPTPTYEVLAEEFNKSVPTIIRYIKGDPMPRKKRRTRKKVA